MQHERGPPIDVHDDDVTAGDGGEAHVLTAGALGRDDNRLGDLAEQGEGRVGRRVAAHAGRAGRGRLAGNDERDGLGTRHARVPIHPLFVPTSPWRAAVILAR